MNIRGHDVEKIDALLKRARQLLGLFFIINSFLFLGGGAPWIIKIFFLVQGLLWSGQGALPLFLQFIILSFQLIAWFFLLIIGPALLFGYKVRLALYLSSVLCFVSGILKVFVLGGTGIALGLALFFLAQIFDVWESMKP